MDVGMLLVRIVCILVGVAIELDARIVYHIVNVRVIIVMIRHIVRIVTMAKNTVSSIVIRAWGQIALNANLRKLRQIANK